MALTHKEITESIGKKVHISTGMGISIEVIIKDYKNTWGRDRWLVQPVAGTGEAWVESYSE